MAAQDPCVQLAQKLASNEKKIRDRAVRKLRGYLSKSGQEDGGFTEEEFTKIWKGLFYCMWMQDKPLLQEDLAHTMSKLIDTLQTKQSQHLFVRTFWQTLSREWNGIDRLRLDKFYTLGRLILRHSVDLLKKSSWEESLVGEFLSLLVQEVLQGSVPRGVQLHLIDIYLDELAKVGAAELPAELNLKLIEPFCKIAAKTKDPLLLQSVLSGIFQSILDQAPFAIEDLMREINHNKESPSDICSEEETTESRGKEAAAQDSDDTEPVLQFDYQAVADRLFALASRKNTPAHNRKRLYRFVKQFRDLAEGVFPQDDFPEEVSTDEDDDEFSSWRFRRRQKKAQEKEGMGTCPEVSSTTDPSQKQESRPIKRGKRHREDADPGEPQEPKETTDPPLSKKKCKKKVAKVSDCSSGQAELRPLAENGETQPQPKKRKSDVPVSPAPVTPSPSPPKKLQKKRSRRGRLIRLGLRLLPLSAGIGRRRMIRQHRIKNMEVLSQVVPAPQAKPSSTHHSKPTPAPQAKSSPAPQARQTLASQTKPKPAAQDFVTFNKTEAPKPAYVKTGKSKGKQIRSKINSESKKVTFSLNRNMTTEFKRTDRSLLVSPTGSSRVAFNPQQKPQQSALKSPTVSPVPRPRAADFF
ncbi:LOW QUALITY PROTEIN: ribosomal RNA processing protein 1 homolog B-like [Rhinophrynus dorsalis]